MRNRHVPRLCRSCQAPAARQDSACWSCGTRWADEDVPETTLRVIAGGAAPLGAAPMPACAHVDAGRWAIDGGSLDSEAVAQVRAHTARSR